MAITVSIGLSKKAGLPDYGSVGAHCNVQFELDGSLLQNDLDGFHRQVRNARLHILRSKQRNSI